MASLVPFAALSNLRAVLSEGDPEDMSVTVPASSAQLMAAAEFVASGCMRADSEEELPAVIQCISMLGIK